MGFGYRDSDWIDPPEVPPYAGTCGQCEEFTACPAGCGWGTCNADGHGFVHADERGCEDGIYAEGFFVAEDEMGDEAFERWRDVKLEDELAKKHAERGEP